MPDNQAPGSGVPEFQFQHLVYLRELERAGTLTGAAERLHVSQPALSQSLAELERRLGVTLFERGGRRRTLTEPGREVARFAGEALGRAAELSAWLAAYRVGGAGTLRIGMIDAASLYVLPGTIAAFREAHPGVELRLLVDTSAQLLAWLESAEIDLAFVTAAPGVHAGSVEVRREPLYVYAPTDAVEQPADARWALYPARSHTRRLIDAGLAARGVLPRVTLESANPEILRQMVRLGIGWSVLPPEVARDLDPAHRALAEPIAWRSLVGLARPGALSDARVQAFLALATGHAALA